MQKNRKTPGILIFAGTTEGRMLAEYVSAYNMEKRRQADVCQKESGRQPAQEVQIRCFVSTATEYGKSILSNLPGVSIRAGRMERTEMRRFIEENEIGLVIDATHPFAREVTENIKAACGLARFLSPCANAPEKSYADKRHITCTDKKRISGADGAEKSCMDRAAVSGVRCVRCLRSSTERTDIGETHIQKTGVRLGESEDSRDRLDSKVIWVDSVKEAVSYLRQTEGNILITTGSRELCRYTEIEDFRRRCFARVLSTREAVEESVRLGFEGRHLIAMQGPFSVEMNLALLKQTCASWFVTKESGTAGGFEEKLKAARMAKASVVVIRRAEEAGESVEAVKRIIREFAEGL